MVSPIVVHRSGIVSGPPGGGGPPSTEFAYTGKKVDSGASTTLTGIATGAADGSRDFVVALSGQYDATPTLVSFAGQSITTIGALKYGTFDYIGLGYVTGVSTGSTQSLVFSVSSGNVYRSTGFAWRAHSFDLASATSHIVGGSGNPTVTGTEYDAAFAATTVQNGSRGTGTIGLADFDVPGTAVESTFWIMGASENGLAAGSKLVTFGNGGGTASRSVIGVGRIPPA